MKKQVRSITVTAIMAFGFFVVIDKWFTVQTLLSSQRPEENHKLSRDKHAIPVAPWVAIGSFEAQADKPMIPSDSNTPKDAVPLLTLQADTSTATVFASKQSEQSTPIGKTATATEVKPAASLQSVSIAEVSPAKATMAAQKKPRTQATSNIPPKANMFWKQFVELPKKALDASVFPKQPLSSSFQPILCPSSIEDAMSKPMLSGKNLSFCEWALSPTGGKVQVGRSWGVLNNMDKVSRDIHIMWSIERIHSTRAVESFSPSTTFYFHMIANI
jgi:hypothetical protein